MADIKTKYKRYNDTSKDFDTIYFKTTADQVLNVSDGKTNGDWKGVLSNKYTVNGQHWKAPAGTSTSELTLTGENIKWKYSENPATVLSIKAKIEAMDVTASGLDSRIAKIEGAYSSGDIITTANMDSKITKVGTIKSGTWNGTAIADAYIASASKWNGYEEKKQNKLTFDEEPTENSSNPVKSGGIWQAIQNTIAVAEGKTNTYVIDPTLTKNGNNVAVDNSEFNKAKVGTDGFLSFTKNIKITVYGQKNEYIEASKLNVGDIILTTGSNIKDWFYAGQRLENSTIHYDFYQIDSDTPDLTVYALKSSLGAAASKGVSKTGPSANGENLVTEAQVKSFVEGKGYITSYTNTTYEFAEGTTNGTFTVTPKGGTAQSVKVHGLAAAAYKGVDTAVFATNSSSANLPTTAAVAGTIAKRATKIFYGPTQPTDMVDGDIWIDTNN